MSSKAQRREMKKSRLCTCRQKPSGTGAHPSSKTCEACRGNTDSMKPGAISTPTCSVILPANRQKDGKRKREASDSGILSEALAPNQPVSSITAAQKSGNPPPASSLTKLELSRTPHSKHKKSRGEQNRPDDVCGICTNRPERQTWESKLGGDKVSWVRCEMKTCNLWFHSSCIMVLLHQDPQSMLFCPGASNDRAIVICPTCVGQPNKGFERPIQQALKAFISTYDAEKLKEVEKALPTACPAHILTALDGIEFGPVREERYNSADDDILRNLAQNLHQSIFDYDIEIQDMVDRTAATSDFSPQMPLAAWDYVDPDSSVIFGKQWFDIDGNRRIRTRRHAPITAAVRAILGTPDKEPLSIPPSVSGLTHSQVHIGLVSWFAFDIIDNQFDVYGLSCMRSTRAMMAGVAAAGEARWPGKGRQHLREVQLRTWYKSEFQPQLLSSDERFKRRFEAFLRPLTKDSDKFNSWSYARRNVIEIAFRLWSYLQSLHGKVVMIQPAIGDTFNAKLHEAYDEEGVELDLRGSLKRKILWILCRGFQYKEDDETDGTRVVTIKARVIVQ